MTEIFQLLDACAGLHVLVIGDAMLDSYLAGTTRRFCPEAPVPILTLTGRDDLPGGAANTAVNVRTLGAEVSFLSVTGDDVEGTLLCETLKNHGVSVERVQRDGARRTLSKQRAMSGGQLLLRLDQGSHDAIGPDMEEALLGHLSRLYPQADAVVVADYNYGILTPRIIDALAELQRRWQRVLVIDSRRLRVFRDVQPTAVKPNYQEALALLGNVREAARGTRADSLQGRGADLLEATGARIAAVTLDQEGAVIFERGRPPYRTQAAAIRQACVAGAGDTFTSAFALGLAAGGDAAATAELAAAAAAVVVGKDLTASCHASELREYIRASGKFVAGLDELATRLDFHRRQGRRTVFTNGCFDILHRGHVGLLKRAKALGDILVVGVNSDASIQRLKGPQRPINALDDRVQVLAALTCIDYIIAFDDDTPCRLIEALRPEVFVKGGDYTRERLPEARIVERFGGTVHILPHQEACSTTRIIERIRDNPAALIPQTT